MADLSETGVEGASGPQGLLLSFGREKPALRPLPPVAADTSVTRLVRVTNRCRVVLDTNRYSVPALYASQRLTLMAFADRLCLYHDFETAHFIRRSRRRPQAAMRPNSRLSHVPMRPFPRERPPLRGRTETLVRLDGIEPERRATTTSEYPPKRISAKQS